MNLDVWSNDGLIIKGANEIMVNETQLKELKKK